MKILPDEQLPVKLKYRIDPAIITSTVRDMQWLGVKDAALFSRVDAHQFDFLITNDQNLKFQVNIKKFDLSLIDLDFRSNRYEDLLSIVPALNNVLLDMAEKNSLSINLKGRIFTLVNQELKEFLS